MATSPGSRAAALASARTTVSRCRSAPSSPRAVAAFVDVVEDRPGVAQPAGQSLELDVVAGREPGAGDVVDVVAGGGQLPLDAPPIASDLLPPPVELSGRHPRLGVGGAGTRPLFPGDGVDDVPDMLGPSQEHMGVLGGELDRTAQPETEGTDRGHDPVEVGAALARGGETAHHHHLVDSSEKRPWTTACSPCGPARSLRPWAPSNSRSAPSSRVFPAPVSPVNTTRPDPGSIWARAMIPRFSTISSSIPLAGTVSSMVEPELAPDALRERPPAEGDEADRALPRRW